MQVALRDVLASDLGAFYEHQRDPAACEMAAFPPRDRDVFFAHWSKILADAAVERRTILVDGDVAGHLVAWPQDGRRFIGYWVDRAHWGRGVATRAVRAFVAQLERPLFAYVAVANVASVRVLEKCGFVCGGAEAPRSGPDGVVEMLLVLA